MLDDIGACVHLLSVGFIVSSAASFKPSSIPTFVLDTRLLEEAWFRFGGRSVIPFWNLQSSLPLLLSNSPNIGRAVRHNSFLPVSIVAWTAALKLCKTSLEVVVLRARQVAP
jgi:hypothetical protein